MKTIYKYPIEIVDFQEIDLPKKALILCVQVQHGAPELWAVVDTENEAEKIKIKVKGTGHPYEDHAYSDLYIGTFQLHQGTLVFHVFQDTKL